MSAKAYDEKFFESQWRDSYQSASLVLPHVLRLVPVTSVLDVGCGVGSWLKSFLDLGVKDVVGVDGGSVTAQNLLIDGSLFLSRDIGRPFSLGRRFDLVTCLEVAEHIPAEHEQFLLGNLCGHADVVLFSAAIPGQGGAGHVNEQWPAHWCLAFKDRGFVAIDCVRPLIWEVDGVKDHYRQNTFLFLKHGHPFYDSLESRGSFHCAPLVHPTLFQAYRDAVSWRLVYRLFLRRLRMMWEVDRIEKRDGLR